MKTLENVIEDLQVDETDVVNVSLILNEKDKRNPIGLNTYKEISKQLEIEIDLDSPIFNEIERFIVHKFYEMEIINRSLK